MNDQSTPQSGDWPRLATAALFVWVMLGVALLITYWPAILSIDLIDPDDSMRMAQVRDLLAGQSWWDLHQYRLNPSDGGVLMHWSRIVDAPIAAGVLALQPFVGTTMAERIVMTAWPLVMGAVLSLSCAFGYRNVPDRRIAYVAPMLLVTMVYVAIRFRPLHVDHHGWQILLAMLMLWQAIRKPGWQAGALAGLCAAALLAISIEGLPIVTLFAALAALRWALQGRADDRDRLCGYMAALAAGSILVQYLTRGLQSLITSWCDALSAPYLGALAVAGVAVLAIARAAPGKLWVRLALLGVSGLLAAAALVLIDPQCAKGPFATLDPIVTYYWYKDVLEGQPVWALPPRDAIFNLVPSIMGLAGTLLAWRGSITAADRRTWATLLIALAGTTAVSLFVTRAVANAHVYALPGCAWLLLAWWDRARAIPGTLPRLIASVATVLLLPIQASSAIAAGLGWAFPAVVSNNSQRADEPSVREACLNPESVAALNRIAPGTVMAPLDLGPDLLFWTHHSVVATGHHRNNEAMADAIRFFIGVPAKGEALAHRRQATLVMICGLAGDAQHYRDRHKEGLAAALYRGQPPAWLEPLRDGGKDGLSVWRVKPAT